MPIRPVALLLAAALVFTSCGSGPTTSELAQSSQASAVSATPPPSPTRPPPDLDATAEPLATPAPAPANVALDDATAPAGWETQPPPAPTPSYPNPLVLDPPSLDATFVVSGQTQQASVLVLGFLPEDYGLREDTIYVHLDEVGHWIEIVSDAPDCVVYVQKGAEAFAVRPADGFLGTRILMERAGAITVQAGCDGATLRFWELPD